MTRDQIVDALFAAARSAVAATLGERAEVVWPALEGEARAAAEEAARELLVLVAAPEPSPLDEIAAGTLGAKWVSLKKAGWKTRKWPVCGRTDEEDVPPLHRSKIKDLHERGVTLTKKAENAAEPLNARVYEDPNIMLARYGVGDREKIQKEIARAIWRWLCTLPEEEKNSYEIARRKMKSQIGGWASVYNIQGKFVIQYRREAGGGAFSLPSRESWQKAVEQIERLAR